MGEQEKAWEAVLSHRRRRREVDEAEEIRINQLVAATNPINILIDYSINQLVSSRTLNYWRVRSFFSIFAHLGRLLSNNPCLSDDLSLVDYLTLDGNLQEKLDYEEMALSDYPDDCYFIGFLYWLRDQTPKEVPYLANELKLALKWVYYLEKAS